MSTAYCLKCRREFGIRSPRPGTVENKRLREKGYLCWSLHEGFQNRETGSHVLIPGLRPGGSFPVDGLRGNAEGEVTPMI